MASENETFELEGKPAFLKRVRLWSLTRELDAAFVHFYRTCGSERLLIENFDRPLPDDLVTAFHALLDALQRDVPESAFAKTERFFENFVPLWRLSQKRNRNLWSAVLSAVTAWEGRRGAVVYKAPLFYHWGESHIRYGDSDRGFILLHRAQEEDQRRLGRRTVDTPAHWFLTLDDGNASDLQPLTFDMVTYVRTRLEVYQDTRRGLLSYEEFRAKFLDADNPALADLQLFFAYTAFKLIKLRVLNKMRDVADDQMAPLIFTTVLSSMLLVVDRLCKMGFYGHEPKMNASFLNHLIALKKLSWKQGERYRNAIQNSRLYDDNFKEVLDALLNGTYKDHEGRSPDPTERDMLLAYRLRNYSAHSVKSQYELWQRFPDVSQSVFNALFLGVERM